MKILERKSVIMDANNQSMMVEGANPNMLWIQHIDYLATQSKIMKKEYIRRKRANKPFTWNDLDIMNKKIHHDLDVVMSGVENVQENKQNTNMNKKLIRLTESDLHKIVKESVNNEQKAQPFDVMLKVFPELKETEDERIRKELLEHCKNQAKPYIQTGNKCPQIQSWIAWLEKQGEHPKKNWDDAELEKKGEEKTMKVYRVENEAEQKGLWRKFDGTWQPLFDMLTDGKCKDIPMEDNPIYREEGKRWFASAPSKKTLQKWFSKRDLEELVSKGFTISEFEVVGCKKVSDFEYIFTRDNIINRNYLEVSDIYPEQKNFAPKFKVGDFVADYYCRGKIVKITDDSYLLDTGQGIPFSCEQQTHFWTIQDAKDGDILFQDLIGGKTFIYNGVNPDMAILYSFIISNDGEDVLSYHIGKPNVGIGNIEENKNIIHPATKKQRDLLFQKMKEVGYTFDFDKKELKKIE